jgi:excisionase family DNA binding protein
MKTIEGVRFYTVKELQAELRITQTTILKYLSLGIIKGVKIGNTWHISEIALREFLGLPAQTV